MKSKTALYGALVLSLMTLTGCIRFQAGTWYQGPEDETPKVHQVDLDSRSLLPGQPPPGDITVD